jgi:hypothetical protein
LKNLPNRRVRARGVQVPVEDTVTCRPGANTGRVFKQALRDTKLFVALGLAILAGGSSAATGETFRALDGATAWPTNNHARWIYGSTPTLGGSFTPFQPVNARTGYYTMNAYRYSQAAFPADYPIIAFNTTTNWLSFGSGQFQVPGETVDLIPGATGTYAAARFLAPESGPHRLSGKFLGLEAGFSDVPATRTDVHVLHNSTNRLFNELVIGQFTERSFDLIVPLNAGDTVDFAVGYGSGYRGNLGDSTGLTATLVLMPVLRIAPGNPLTLSWPTNATGFFLESVTNLPFSGPWARLGETPTVVGTNFVVPTASIDSPRFFRLRKSEP